VLIVGVQRKQLYLNADAAGNDLTGGLDRVDPVFTNDTTTLRTANVQATAGSASFTIQVDDDGPDAGTTTGSDTWIQEDSGGNDNYGNSNEIKIKETSTSQDRAGLIQFDLSSIASGNTVTSATLTVNVTKSGSNTIRVHRIDNTTPSAATWTETGVTWGNFASGGFTIDSTVVGSFSASTTGNKTVDVTSVVQQWIDYVRSSGASGKKNFGFALTGLNSTEIQLETKEDSTANQAVLAVNMYTGTPGVVTFTQNAAMVSPFTMPAGGAVTVRTYIEVTSADLPFRRTSTWR